MIDDFLIDDDDWFIRSFILTFWHTWLDQGQSRLWDTRGQSPLRPRWSQGQSRLWDTRGQSLLRPRQFSRPMSKNNNKSTTRSLFRVPYGSRNFLMFSQKLKKERRPKIHQSRPNPNTRLGVALWPKTAFLFLESLSSFHHHISLIGRKEKGTVSKYFRWLVDAVRRYLCLFTLRAHSPPDLDDMLTNATMVFM